MSSITELCSNIAASYDPWPLVEQKNRNAPSEKPDEQILPVRAIVIPNPEDTPLRTISTQDFVSLSVTADRPWTANDEPIDFTRNLFDSYQLELDYFYSFVNNNLKGLHISGPKAYTQASTLSAPPSGAICDTSEDDKKHLRILHISPTAPNRGLDQSTIVSALTSPLAFDIVDYRRQTMLGQSFLNFAVSLFLLQEHRHWHLGWLRECHSKMLSARNLAYLGIAKRLPGSMKLFPFCPKNDWAPPRKCVPRTIQEYVRSLNVSPHTLFRLTLSEAERASGAVAPENMYEFVATFLDEDAEVEQVSIAAVCSQEESSMNNFIGLQRAPDESVSASLAAIIGECVKTFGVATSGKLLKTFGIVPEKCVTDVEKLLQTAGFVEARVSPNVANQSIDRLIVNFQHLEAGLGYTFKNRGYLLQALTHPSFPTNPFTDCNQRLAFLGSALIDLLITAHISERADHLSADELIDLRAALTSQVALACYCVRYNFHVFLLTSNMSLSEKISSFVTFQEHHEHRLNDQVLLLIEESDTRMGEFIDVPTAIGDAFAAVVAAIFVDSGNDLVATWNVLYQLVRQDVDALLFRVPREVVQRLTEYPGAKPKFDKPHVEEDVIMVNVRFTRKNEVIQMQGFGRTAVEAKKAAAKVALHALLQ